MFILRSFIALALLCTITTSAENQKHLRTAYGAFENTVPTGVDFAYNVVGSCAARFYKTADGMSVIDADYDWQLTSDEPLTFTYAHIHYVAPDGSEPKFAWSTYYAGENSGNYGSKVIGGLFTDEIYDICMKGKCFINLHMTGGAGFAKCFLPAYYHPEETQEITTVGYFENTVPTGLDFPYDVVGSCSAQLYKTDAGVPVIDADYDWQLTSDEPLTLAYSHIHYVAPDGSEPKFAWSTYYAGETSGNYGSKVIGGLFTDEIYDLCLRGKCFINLHMPDGAGFAKCFLPAKPSVCIWGTGCSDSMCEPGTECKESTWWSQCVEIENIYSDKTCISTQNGHGPTAHWGCNSDSDCCNPSATCGEDKHCRLPCEHDKLMGHYMGTGDGRSLKGVHVGVGLTIMTVGVVLLIAVGAGSYLFYNRDNQNQKQTNAGTINALQNKNYFEVDDERVDDDEVEVVEIAVIGGQE